MKSAKTPLLRLLQKSFSQTAQPYRLTRRSFLRKSIFASGALMIGSTLLESFTPHPHKEKVIVLGAGIAGLYSTLLLRLQGINAQLYEASSRHGGRMYSKQNITGEGITTELGAEFIDSTHEDILTLARVFNLPLLDMEKDNELQKYVYYFEGKKYNCEDVKNALLPFAASIQNDIDSLPEIIRYDNYSDAKKWDEMSITQYLKSKGMNGWLLSLFQVAFTTEYGLDADEQSALNMMFLLDTSLPGCSLFGTSDERYKIVGGNQRITDSLAENIENIHYNHQVSLIEDYNDGYRVHFTNGEKIFAHHVICTIPFSILRNINLKLKEMSPIKRKCIHELGYGRNAKVFAGYNKNMWRKKGLAGEVFTDKNFQLGWEHSQLQNTRTCGYTFFTGGAESDKMKKVSLDEKVAKYTNQLEEVFAGSKNEFNGKIGQFYWPEFPYALGSYACYKKGQWTSIAGAESEPIGNILFAGEHCSVDFQGFMNGGAETGRIAAEALLQKLKK